MPNVTAGNVITDSAQILPGIIVDSDINASAAIAYSKLALALGIVNADISTTAAIVDTKLAQITTASKVSGAAITLLTSLPAAAGVIPTANLPATGATLSASATQVSFSNTAAEQTLATFTLAANTLGTAGAVRVFVPVGDYRAVDNLTFKIYIGATSVSAVMSGSSNNNIWSGFIEGWIMGAGATNSQRLTIHSQLEKTETIKVGSPEIGHTYGTGTAAEDTTAALTVKITATFGAANASDIFRSDGYSAKN